MLHRPASNKSPSQRRERLVDVFWASVALLIIALGVIGFTLMGALRAPVEAVSVARTPPLVETAEVRWHDASIPIAERGFIRPTRQVALSAETSGRVVGLHPAVRTRGRVSEGEVIARLDDRAARAVLERAKSDIESTQARLDLNATQLQRARALRERGVISEDELDRRLAEESELKATLASLSSALESARVALDATLIKAPFDGQILDKQTELGAVLNPGQSVVTLFTPDALEVSIALEETEAALIPALVRAAAHGVENVSDALDTVQASVTARFAGKAYTWPASIQRVAPTLSERTRTLAVTVDIDRDEGDALPAPALVNAWARVLVEGKSDAPVIAVSSAYVRANDTLWFVIAERLRIVSASVLQVTDGTSYVTFDDVLPDGFLKDVRLVTSLLSTPVDGMAVRVADPSTGAVSPEDARVVNR